MSAQIDHQVAHSQAGDAWTDYGSDFVLIAEGKPPPRIAFARQSYGLGGESAALENLAGWEHLFC